MPIQLEARGLRKTFSRRVIFDNIDAAVREGETLTVAGA